MSKISLSKKGAKAKATADEPAAVAAGGGTRKSSRDDKVTEQYHTQAYWDNRYQLPDKEGHHCWYYTFDELLPFFDRLLGEDFRTNDPRPSILEIGVGDSPLIHNFAPKASKPKQKPAAEGQLHGIDFSETIIHHLQTTLAPSPQLAFSCMDATRMSFASHSFNLIIDKGTVDAMLCGAGANEADSAASASASTAGRKRKKPTAGSSSSSSEEDKFAPVRAIISEALRVLSADGTFLLVSHMHPDSKEFAAFTNECLLPAVADAAFTNDLDIDASKRDVNNASRTNIEKARGVSGGGGGKGRGRGGGVVPRLWSMECHVTPRRATVYLVTSRPGKATRSGGGGGGLSVSVHDYGDGSDEEDGDDEEDEDDSDSE